MSNHDRSLTQRWLSFSRFGLLAVMLLSFGCTDAYIRYHMGGGPQVPDRPHEPYNGTGVVKAVEIKPPAWKTASVNFGAHPPPRENVHLLIVRSNAVVGKASARWGGKSVWIVEGIPQTGDLVIGVQNEWKYNRR